MRLGLALGYVEGRLPSFVTPPPVIEQTRFAHCSCRNTSGPGYDALAWLGTSNWEGDYFTKSRNVGLILEGAPIAKALAKFFDDGFGSSYSAPY